MPEPVAFKLKQGYAPTIHAISLDGAIGSRLSRRANSSAPAILAVTHAAFLEGMGAGVFDAENAQVLADGDWSNAWLLVMPEKTDLEIAPERKPDQEFLSHVARTVPDLSNLAAQLARSIRAAGIDGDLRLEGHRWVNRPLNTFTLTVQPRVKNFQFTLYGGPDRFGVTDFIRSDQNGYSRGWVRSEADIPKFIELAKIAHARKAR